MTGSHPCLHGIRLILLTLSLGLGTFIQVLDSSIANVSISHIAGDLAVSPNEGTWVITSFAISNGIILAITGWLAERFGGIKLFVWSTTLFSITSWLCGLAWNLPLLVFFRILQGASAGALIPLSQALLLTNYPEERKGVALGFWSMIVIVAPILGPIVGGYITDNYGWPWIFYINIPIGFFSAWLTWFLIGQRHEKTTKRPIDFIAFALLTIAISTLQIFLDKGEELDWFSSNFICVLITTSIIAFTFFIPWNAYSEHPIMNFSYFRHRTFTIGTILGALGFLMFFGSNVLLPLWLETQMNYTAFWSGVAVMPVGILPLFLSSFVGKFVTRVDPRWMSTFSFLMFSITFFWFSVLTPDISLFELMHPRFLQGLGLSFFFIPLVTISLSAIPNPELAGASGVFNFVRLIAGGGFGTALYVTLWDRREIFHHSRLTEITTIYNPLTTQFYRHLDTTLGTSEAVNHNILEGLITQQAYLLAVNDVFYLTGWTFLLCIPLIWFCGRIEVKKGQQAALD
ncbi:DHA2 family efflux MFS transporter permease subunit [Candidatus Protochlamydia phocaeensis]|uniref:DHA2 family efflux MFS transporter permease subunit n=1 Tax=Candidatus Protochlamydia phocaeensis TaxID=1414722 RepID=UPI000838AE9E|nr:DHA2 family efflux MFS transporter permease subunit [Candidatus Protochlamydia phocaeensis]